MGEMSFDIKNVSFLYEKSVQVSVNSVASSRALSASSLGKQ